MTEQSYKLPVLLEQFLGDPGLSDCLLVCEDGEVRCHSTMLGVASARWRDLLLHSLDQQESFLTLLLPDFNCSTITTFLEILYKGGTKQSDTVVLQDTLSLLRLMLPELNLPGSKARLDGKCLVMESRNYEDNLHSSESPEMESYSDLDCVLKRDGYSKFEKTT